MSTIAGPRPVPATVPEDEMLSQLGPIGRLGRWNATHFRAVVITWVVIIVALGVFAPRAEHALSGAGWEANGSESVAARELIQANFQGLSSAGLMVVVHSDGKTIDDPAFRQTLANVEDVLSGNDSVSSIVPPQEGLSISQDGHVAVVQAGTGTDTKGMVAAANELAGPLSEAAAEGVEVDLTGASGMWADFNEANKNAMMKSELISWPITLGILVLAFGSLVAAGLPLLLTIAGLVSAAGTLFLVAQAFDISIWAMNFALMFALALGIDYALFIVMRYRGAHFGSKLKPADAVAVAMDTAGKAVLFSGVTVLISLSAVMLVPSPAFRSMALGIMFSVIFVLAASLTLLPAVLARLGDRVNKWSLRWARQGEHRSARFARWGELTWRRPWALGAAAVAILVALAVPVLQLDTGMPSIAVVPKDDSSRQGYVAVQKAFGPGATGPLQLVAPVADAATVTATAQADPGIAMVMPAQRSEDGTLVLVQAVPAQDPSDPAVGGTIDRLRDALPAGTLVGGAVAENHDLEAALGSKTRS